MFNIIKKTFLDRPFIFTIWIAAMMTTLVLGNWMEALLIALIVVLNIEAAMKTLLLDQYRGKKA